MIINDEQIFLKLFFDFHKSAQKKQHFAQFNCHPLETKAWDYKKKAGK